MKKIAILGGTFDPITNAHLDMCRFIRDKYNTEVLILPTKNTRWKDNISSVKDRINMIKLALADEYNISLCELETKSKSNKVNYTIDVIFELLDIYKNYKIYYIIGSDQLDKLDKWKDIDELSKIVKFVVINRDSYPINKINLKKYNCIDTKYHLNNISSTDIRNLKSNDTKESVIKYIKDHGLYLKPILKNMLTKDRYDHSIRVASLAKKMARYNKVDVNKAYVAGLIHDCAKNIKYDKTLELMMKYEPEYLNVGKKVYHQYIAPVIAKDILKIDDEEILTAIKYHTTSRLNATKLDKIIYCADKLEPGREFDTTYLRDKCLKDINIGFALTYILDMEFIKAKTNNISIESYKILDNCNIIADKYKLYTIVKALDDHFGYDIKIYDVSNITPLNKYSIIVSCDSDRQLLGINNDIKEIVEINNFDYHHSESQYKSGWVLIDLVDIVINLFKRDYRGIYDLDKLYKDCDSINLDDILSKKF